jgi:hypothetical protein
MKLMRPTLVCALALLLLGCSRSGRAGEEKSGQDKGSAPPTQAAVKTDRAKAESASIKGETRRESAAGISFQVPITWKTSAPSSNMRAAQFQLPADTNGAAGELVLFFFGAGQGGGVQANIDRWIGQMTQPDRKASRDVARTDTLTVGPFNITTVSLTGAYGGSSMMPGMGSVETKPSYGMWGAVVEGAGGPWFFKAVGPEAVMVEAAPDFGILLASLQAAKP